ncbi:hypothetical protein [Aureimonas glaciei]|jgi:hypothetical protein|nr:hypothetical protein [Aureimonas glaciei]
MIWKEGGRLLQIMHRFGAILRLSLAVMTVPAARFPLRSEKIA